MLAAIANTFSNCFKIPELKSRILFTIAVLAIARLEAYIRLPGLNSAPLLEIFDKQSHASPLGLVGMFAGGALQNCAIGALTIIPYISATIIIQLLAAVYPPLSKLMREEGGRTKIVQYGRYLTVILCLGYGFVTAMGYEHPETVLGGEHIERLVLYPDSMIWWYRIQTMLILTTGTMLLMWLGEQITERGIGNGVSLIITVNILSRLPQALQGVRDMFFTGGPESKGKIGNAIVLLLLLAGMIAGIIAVTQAQRKIPVQYAQRAVGRKVYAGGTSFMPLRVNYAGVMPIIFAQSILMFPEQILGSIGRSWNIKLFKDISEHLREGAMLHIVIYAILILFFSAFWVATTFNELQIADDLKKNGGYIPGVRPGQATSEYLHTAMSRITVAGAFFLVIIAVVPMIMSRLMNVQWQVSQFFGGTSMLITVGVLLDTMRQMESHLLMRHYDGFLKKGRLKGRF